MKEMKQSAHQGLTTPEVHARQLRYGRNILPKQAPPSHGALFLSQLKSPLIYVLIFAGMITIVLRHFSDSLIIFAAVFINTILGYIQERKADQAFRTLLQYISHSSEVMRDGKRIKINVEDIVVDDSIILSQGTIIPADGILTFTNRMYCNEAIITGESSPVVKNKDDSVFMGTTVTSGQAIMKVSAIGSTTKIGTIATEIQTREMKTPLQRQLHAYSKKLVITILALVLITFVLGILRGKTWDEMFLTSVALAVSSIPEGLTVSLTVILAIGMQNILKRKGLVRRLASAETLGGVTTICIDKTGTLTEGKMKVVACEGNEKEIALQVLLANDLDDPIVIAAYEWAKKNSPLPPHNTQKQLDSIPFSPKDRVFLSLHTLNKDSNVIFVHGAPEILLERSTLQPDEKSQMLRRINTLTSEGRRIIGLAKCVVPNTHKTLSLEDAKRSLVWVGMLAFFDPVRPSVKHALEQATQAGIHTVVITGDYSNTASFVLHEIGIILQPHEIMTGEQLEKLSPSELAHQIQHIRLFARTTPDQKLRIVKALQESNQVVAMMGDGVNDAPAIHTADIGIVVNEASDVSRESADMVLLDSNFSTIIAAIEEGRAIFDNIRKIILYLLGTAFAEIILVVGSIALGLPLPVLAVQIIWVNLISDGLPGLALIIDPKRHGLMHESPRNPSEPLVNSWMISLIAIISGLAGLIALAVFVLTYTYSHNLEIARTTTFLTLGLNSLAYVFSVRTLLVPFWNSKLFENIYLVLAVIIGFGLQCIPFLNQHTRAFFGIVHLDLKYWGIAIGLSVLLYFAVEVFKAINMVIHSKKSENHL